jgi:hypothetical protein
MNRRGPVLRLVAISLLLPAGCAPGALGPTRKIEVPGGGPPVLTTAERAEKGLDPTKTQVSAVMRASYEEPLNEPQHLKRFNEWTEQEAAADALGRIGVAAVPSLVQALQSPDAAARRTAAEVLGRMGPDAADAVPQLVPLLDDPDPAVRKAAARTLGRIGPPAQDAIPALMRTLLQPPPQSPPPQ